jgi:predicted porin
MQIRHFSTIAALALTAVGSQAQTATGPEFYGLLDVTVRYSTNQDAAGDSKGELTDGVLTGSRLGLRGKRTIGTLSAFYTAEAGFAPDTGTSGQGGRLLGRQLFAGIEGGLGTLIAGRQYTAAHDILSRFDSMGFANNSIVGYQGGNYTGLRYDNTVKYVKVVGPVSIQLGHTFGEVTGNSNGSAEGIGAVYANGPLTVGGAYQQTKAVSSGFFGAVAAANASTQTVWGGGATYQAGPAKVYLGYTDSNLDVADYKNKVFYVGTNYQATDALQLVVSIQSDKLTHLSADGNRLTTAYMADYFLDKNTDVYAELDYTKVTDAWVPLANNSALGSGNMFGKDSRTGVMVGLRVKF